MTYQYLNLSKKDSIATVVMQRAECGNALSLKSMAELIVAMDSFKYDTETRVVIIKGEGNHFCVGADLKDPDRKPPEDNASLIERNRTTQIGRDLINAITNLNQISIAAVQGVAAGGGACITTACDFRIGTSNCKIGYPEVKLGMNLSWGALPLCYNLVGPATAKRMVIGGELETAEDLYTWGFLDELVELDQLTEKALEMAHFYASRPPLAAQMIKRGINAIQNAANGSIMHMDGDQFTLATQSEDYAKAREEFLNRKV